MVWLCARVVPATLNCHFRRRFNLFEIESNYVRVVRARYDVLRVCILQFFDANAAICFRCMPKCSMPNVCVCVQLCNIQTMDCRIADTNRQKKELLPACRVVMSSAYRVRTPNAHSTHAAHASTELVIYSENDQNILQQCGSDWCAMRCVVC